MFGKSKVLTGSFVEMTDFIFLPRVRTCTRCANGSARFLSSEFYAG
jgi:hypothetical protein